MILWTILHNVLWIEADIQSQNNIMKFIAISVLATVSCGASSIAPHRKRSIENKYVSATNIIDEEKNEEFFGSTYLGYRKLEESISMSMANDGEYW